MKRRPKSRSPVTPFPMWSKPALGTRNANPRKSARQWHLLGRMSERIKSKGERSFCGTIAGAIYLLTPVSSIRAAAMGDRKWNLHVIPADSSVIHSILGEFGNQDRPVLPNGRHKFTDQVL
jgi:hypothetical protein